MFKALAFLLLPATLWAQALPSLDNLPRPSTPPPERASPVPAQMQRWREEAQAAEHGEDGVPRDPVRAAQLYCRAARYGDALAQFNLAWMLTNGRGIERDDAQAAHLFAAAAEQGLEQAQAMAQRLGTPLGPPPECLIAPPLELPAVAKASPGPKVAAKPAALPIPPNAPEPIVRFVTLTAPQYQLAPALVLAVMAKESNFNPLAESPKNAHGLMQLIPDTAARFRVKNLRDPAQNIQGGMAYLRWLLAYFEGDLPLALAAYNAGEGAVDRYRGIPPYAETQDYVRRILDRLNWTLRMPFDATAAKPSAMLALRKKTY
ncbi:soluble lytic murein transglycosylase-like protein [Inhella inkyongensis]|uniref:Soluble lytic murein transglycosylase-like protein n=1 Tax=Inhella inkyongensis TaxID=392593 RepID=A0A840S0W9_9BURK|nr:lytic transglycosylase domain-containing protein [Inhella inkyongensis]MBB5203162.1 soluble lytic murein transglycosylase-like protein [Inhella inkyongensis]